MSRTNRKFCTNGNLREARKGRTHKIVGYRRVKIKDPAVPWAPGYGGPSRVHGGMLMSPSNSGMWRDEYGPDNTRVKRAVKRGERQRVAREIEQQLLPDAPDPVEDEAHAQEEWEAFDCCCDECAGDALDYDPFDL